MVGWVFAHYEEMTVLGFTKTRASSQRAQVFESHAQSTRYRVRLSSVVSCVHCGCRLLAIRERSRVTVRSAPRESAPRV